MKGFTIVELIISIAIFALMTALVVARYGSFNQNTLLTNVAYDMALTIRTAQTYGLSVKSVGGDSDSFGSAYGIAFDLNDRTHFTLFADTNNNGVYDENSGEAITKYTLTQGVTISNMCLAADISGCSTSGAFVGATQFDIVYKRPNPNAVFNLISAGDIQRNQGFPAAFISLTSSDGTHTEVVYVRKNGQISVGN